jgi:hypothetical protein
VGFRLPNDVTARVDEWAEQRGLNRSSAIRMIIMAELNRETTRRRNPAAA